MELKEQAAELPYIKLKSFHYGKIAAMLSISDNLNFIEIVNKHTNKKKIEGLTVGEYLLLNIIGRCDGALSSCDESVLRTNSPLMHDSRIFGIIEFGMLFEGLERSFPLYLLKFQPIMLSKNPSLCHS